MSLADHTHDDHCAAPSVDRESRWPHTASDFARHISPGIVRALDLLDRASPAPATREEIAR